MPPESASSCSRTARNSSRIGCFFFIGIATKELRRRTNQHLPEPLPIKQFIDARKLVRVGDMSAIQGQQVFYASEGSRGNVQRVCCSSWRHRMRGKQSCGERFRVLVDLDQREAVE